MYWKRVVINSCHTFRFWVSGEHKRMRVSKSRYKTSIEVHEKHVNAVLLVMVWNVERRTITCKFLFNIITGIY